MGQALGGRQLYGWNGHRYRGGFFRYPTGHAYRRWDRGQVPPPDFLSAA